MAHDISRWLRDYVYIPWAATGGKLLTYRNLMLTMLLGGSGLVPAGHSSSGEDPRVRLALERWRRDRPAT